MRKGMMGIPLLFLAAGIAAAQTGPILLEDFRLGNRHLLNLPAEVLWTPVVGEESGQILAIANNKLTLTGSTEKNCGGNVGCGMYLQVNNNNYGAGVGGSFLQNYVISGSFTPAVNRLRFSMRCNKFITSGAPDYSSGYMGTYVKPHDNINGSEQGQHYYHGLYGTIYANRWRVVEINSHPWHIVGGGAGEDTPNDPEWVAPTKYKTDVNGNNIGSPEPVHYFDGLTRLYFDSVAAEDSTGHQDPDVFASPAACEFQNFYFDTDTTSPDDLVANVTATYSGPSAPDGRNNQFFLGFGVPSESGRAYNIYYATFDMKASGLAGATSGGTVTQTSSYENGMIWVSPTVAYPAGGMYFAIQPTASSCYPCFTQVYLPALDGPTALAIATTSPLPNGAVGTPYSQALTAYGGTAPYAWARTAGTLCGGLTLSAGGAITGTPLAEETCSFTARVTDNIGTQISKAFSLSIVGPSVLFVQATTGRQCNGVTSCTTTVIDTTTHNLLVLGVTASAAPTSIADSKGNANWQLIGSAPASGGDTVYLYYHRDISGGASHTVTVNGPAGTYFALALAEYSGAHLTAPLGPSAARSSSGATQSTSPVTTTGTNNLLVAIFNQTAGVNAAWSAGTGYTLRSSVGAANAGSIIMLEDRVAAGPATYTATATFGSESGGYSNVIATILMSGLEPPATPRPVRHRVTQ